MVDTSILLLIVLNTAAGVLYAYDAYWGFNIRRALAVRLYRNQALGIALVAAGFAAANLLFVLIFYVIPTFYSDAIVFVVYVPVGTVFYMIDAAVLASRRSDPLLRDTFHWRRLRTPLWFANVALIVALGLGFLLLHDLLYNNIALEYFLFSLPPLITGVCGVTLLPIVARRSRDTNMRRHMKWFGVFGAMLLTFFFGAGATTDFFISQMLWNVPSIVGGYALYRSVRALVPLNRISLASAD